MKLNLIAMITIIIIISLLGIGIFLYLIIIWSDRCTTPEEQYYEDLEQMEYIRKFNENKNKNKK